jgi:hypothetical protein
MRRHISIGLVAAACALAGCGGDDNGGSSGDKGYPKVAEDNFIKSCSAQQGATQQKCQCAFDKIKAKLSFDEFKAADTALREGKQADPKATQALKDAVSECR